MMKGSNSLETLVGFWDDLYKRLKTVDEKLRKANRNTLAIKDALLGYIASFGLSMIKDFYLHNITSVGFLFSLAVLLRVH
jgi:ABC-type phosphate transport system auxiliary subunit